MVLYTIFVQLFGHTILCTLNKKRPILNGLIQQWRIAKEKVRARTKEKRQPMKLFSWKKWQAKLQKINEINNNNKRKTIVLFHNIYHYKWFTIKSKNSHTHNTNHCFLLLIERFRFKLWINKIWILKIQN